MDFSNVTNVILQGINIWTPNLLATCNLLHPTWNLVSILFVLPTTRFRKMYVRESWMRGWWWGKGSLF